MPVTVIRRQPTFKIVSEDHVQKMMAEIESTELELIEAMSMLEVKRSAYKARQQENQQLDADSREHLRMTLTFWSSSRNLTRRVSISIISNAMCGNPIDAARVAAQNQFNKLQKEYDDLWVSKYPEILKRLSTTSAGGGQSIASIQELEQRVETLKSKKAKLTDHFKVIQVEHKASNDDTFEAAFLSHQVQSLLNWEEVVKRNLEQLKFEAGQDKYRVVLVDSAAASRTPSNNKRLKYMAAAPVGVLFAMLGLFLFLEIKAERVADPDALSTRVRSEVYALPPLPTARSLRKLSASECR